MQIKPPTTETIAKTIYRSPSSTGNTSNRFTRKLTSGNRIRRVFKKKVELNFEDVFDQILFGYVQ